LPNNLWLKRKGDCPKTKTKTEEGKKGRRGQAGRKEGSREKQNDSKGTNEHKEESKLFML
jgi:hypothetical protein